MRVSQLASGGVIRVAWTENHSIFSLTSRQLAGQDELARRLHYTLSPAKVASVMGDAGEANAGIKLNPPLAPSMMGDIGGPVAGFFA